MIQPMRLVIVVTANPEIFVGIFFKRINSQDQHNVAVIRHKLA